MPNANDITAFLPTTRREMELRGWDDLDVILFSGDAYVDHPSFGVAVIGRVIEAQGLRVGIVPQPSWHGDLRDFKRLGRPRLFFGISPGCMDSMVNKYTAARRLRSEDAYSPDGRHDMRPEYPTIVYTECIRKIYPDAPIVLGGIEASLRRLSHYDYWQDRIRPSILCDCDADLITYGMGEKPTIELVNRLVALLEDFDPSLEYDEMGNAVIGRRAMRKALETPLPQSVVLYDRMQYEASFGKQDATTFGKPCKETTGKPFEASIVKPCKTEQKVDAHQDDTPKAEGKRRDNAPIVLFSYEDCLRDPHKQSANFRHIEEQSNMMHAVPLVQQTGDCFVVVYPMYPPLSTEELDSFYDLPYTRLPHPKYKGKRIPAFDMIRFSVTMHRGCFGGCAFCTISAHQGKFISSRSKESILREVRQITHMPDFHGTLSDLGGPSANMYGMKGRNLKACEVCKRPSCIHPSVCPNLNADHAPLTDIYRSVDALPGIKHSYIGSGVRYDLLLHPYKDERLKRAAQAYTTELITKHVSGRLKVAPEHTSDTVLDVMRKPSFRLFGEFKRIFDATCRRAGLRQQIIPYFISSHPGCSAQDMAELAVLTKDLDFQLEQVQDFTPTPMTVATEAWHSGVHPYTLQPIFSARTPKDKEAQRMFFFWYKPEFQRRIIDSLRAMHREDLLNRLYKK